MLDRSPPLLPFVHDAAFLNDRFCCWGKTNLDENSHGGTIELLQSLLLNVMSTPELGGINPVSNLLCLPETERGHPMPKSKKPKARRPGANPVKKPAWHQALNGTAGQHGGKPTKTGKKAQNKSA